MATDTSQPPARPHISERPVYEPRCEVEAFIVPLLREHIESRLNDLLSEGLPAQVLDAGCGRQPFRLLIERRGALYSSMDAVQNEDSTVDHVATLDGHLPEDLIKNGPYALIVCTEVLEHVADWDAAFRNLKRLSRAGGTVLITCPFFYVLHEEPYDFWRPTTHAIAFYAKRHNFEIVELAKLGTTWDVLGTILGASPIARGHWSIQAWVAHAIVSVFRNLALRVIRYVPMIRRIDLAPNLYLCNLAVLKSR